MRDIFAEFLKFFSESHLLEMVILACKAASYNYASYMPLSTGIKLFFAILLLH